MLICDNIFSSLEYAQNYLAAFESNFKTDANYMLAADGCCLYCGNAALSAEAIDVASFRHLFAYWSVVAAVASTA